MPNQQTVIKESPVAIDAERANLAVYVRNFTFGVEDSLVSTVGLLSGIAAAGTSKPIIFMTGMILIFVEAFSMGVGSLLSEHSAEEFYAHAEISIKKPIKGSIVMFVSYFLAGFIPLAPYIFLPLNIAFWTSIFLSLFALFLLGAISGKLFRTRIMRNGLKMLLIGGMAIIVGVVVGQIANT